MGRSRRYRFNVQLFSVYIIHPFKNSLPDKQQSRAKHYRFYYHGTSEKCQAVKRKRYKYIKHKHLNQRGHWLQSMDKSHLCSTHKLGVNKLSYGRFYLTVQNINM
jgi:hypothetical protein